MSKTETRPNRRAALLGDRPGAYAIAKHIRMSSTKVRRVVDVVRGMDVAEALDVLKFAPQAASEPVLKVVASATANAESAESLHADDLFISQAFVDEGVTFKRIRPRAKGSADRVMKRGAHITVVVEPKSARHQVLPVPAQENTRKRVPVATEPAEKAVKAPAEKAAKEPAKKATKAAAEAETPAKAAAEAENSAKTPAKKAAASSPKEA